MRLRRLLKVILCSWATSVYAYVRFWRIQGLKPRRFKMHMLRHSVEEACLEIVEEVLLLGRDPAARQTEWLVKKALQRLKGLNNSSRALLARRCLGVTCWRGRLEYVLGDATRGLPPREVARLMLALYIRDIEGRIEPAQEQGYDSLIDDREDLSRALSSIPTADAIDLPADPAGRIAASKSLPLWLAQQWVAQYGEDGAAALADEANVPGPVTLRLNLLRAGSRDALRQRLDSEGVRCEDCRWSPLGLTLLDGRPPSGLWGLAAWREGLFEVQDEGSQLIALATGLATWREGGDSGGPSVLDLCAGHGGKTLAMAALTGDRGETLAYDVDASRLKQLEAAGRKAGLRSVRVVWTEGELEARGQRFDVVLVDAPCSSSGVLRRRPSLRWALDPHQALHALPLLQADLLGRAAAMVREGGVLLYATCSLLRQENQGVALRFESSAAGQHFEGWPMEGQTEEGRLVTRWPSTEGPRHMLALLPHEHGTDGFFIARWVRRKPGGA